MLLYKLSFLLGEVKCAYNGKVIIEIILCSAT